MKYLRQRLAVAIFAASVVGAAGAQSEQDGVDPMTGSTSQDQAAAPNFNDLDKDQDGYISAVEATGDSTLMEGWTEADTNSDRKIDQSEFSKFETNESQPTSAAPADEGMSQGMKEAQEQGMQQPQQEMQQNSEDAGAQY